MSSGLDDGFSRSVSMVLLELLATTRRFDQIFPPLVALFDAAGLERSGGIIAPPGHDFALERLAEQIEEGLEMHGLKGQDAQSFTTLITSWHHWFESNRGATEVSPTTDDSAADLLDAGSTRITRPRANYRVPRPRCQSVVDPCGTGLRRCRPRSTGQTNSSVS
ncbi:MAG: hypothetical protein R2735_15730 [Microthrixaceae bacterium]